MQPWADQILDGSKIVENRTWNTSYRGPLLIHSGVRQVTHGGAERERGALGVVLLVSVHVAVAGCCALAGAERPDGRVLRHFVLARPFRFAAPFPMRGWQRIFEPDRHASGLVHARSLDWPGWNV
jgi:hypothetical protein